jgi:hypothetical protein
LARHSDQVLNAVLSMADRQDLPLAGRVDLRRKVFELTAIIGEPSHMVPIPNLPRGGPPIRSIGGLRTGLAGAPDGPGALVGVRSAGRRVREAFLSCSHRGSLTGGIARCPLRLLQAISRRGAFSEDPQIPLDPRGYSGLRGEGSAPVPLPPPVSL